MAQTDPEDGFDQIMVQSWNSVAQQSVPGTTS